MSGCISDNQAVSTDTATPTTTTETSRPTTDTPSLTENEQSPTNDPTPSPTATPPVNQTQYSVGYPWIPFEETYLQSEIYLLADTESLPALTVLDTQKDWQELIADTDNLSGYPFVANTTFDSESVIIVEYVYQRRTYPTVTEITGISAGDITITLSESGPAIQNADVHISLFIRIPKNQSSISSVTIQFLDNRITISENY